MSSSYQRNRQWSDRFIPQIRALVGPHLLVESSLEQDTKQAADLVVLRARDLTIACRVRRHGFADVYPRQFTLRSKLDSGVMTEFRKVLQGWGDWMFYGHSSLDEKSISPWWLIDLSALRFHLIHDAHRRLAKKESRLRQGSQANGDGTHFQWFDIDTFDPDPPLLVAESHPTPFAPSPRPQRLQLSPTAEEIFGR